MLLCLCVWCIFATVCVWRSKNNFQELVLFFNQMGPRNLAQAVSYVSGAYLLSHLTSLGFALLYKYCISHIYSSPRITQQEPLPWWFLNAEATEEASQQWVWGHDPSLNSLECWQPKTAPEAPTSAFYLRTSSQIFLRNPGVTSYQASSGHREGVSWKTPFWDQLVLAWLAGGRGITMLIRVPQRLFLDMDMRLCLAALLDERKLPVSKALILSPKNNFPCTYLPKV